MKDLSVLMSYNDYANKEAKRIQALVEAQDAKVEIISLPYNNDSKNHNYDSILAWKFVHITTEFFIALDLLAGTIENKEGVIWLVSKTGLEYNDNILPKEWEMINEKIMSQCKNRRIFASSKAIAEYYERILGINIPVCEMETINQIIELIGD